MKKIWSLSKVKETAKQYNTITEWRSKKLDAYTAAYKYGWLKECCLHMTGGNKKWDKKACIKAALKCKSRSEFKNMFPGAYITAIKNKWLEECTAHMKIFKHVKGYWNLERCKQEAKKYSTKIEWLKNSAITYQTARRNVWLKLTCKHMIVLRKKKK